MQEDRLIRVPVTLHDIKDVERFVADVVGKLEPFKGGVRNQEFEELVCEGLTILYELADKFEPQRDGYASAGRFSGFAAYFLPKKLATAWHRAHPEHSYVVGADGKREWEYRKQAVSLDGMYEETGGGAGAHHERSSSRDAIDLRLLDPSKWVPVPAVTRAAA